MAELLEDVRSAAHQFSPSALSLLDVMLCACSPTTDFHHKCCSYGKGKDCGWSARMADVDIQDEIQLGEDDEAKAVAVNFKAYKKCRSQTARLALIRVRRRPPRKFGWPFRPLSSVSFPCRSEDQKHR